MGLSVAVEVSKIRIVCRVTTIHVSKPAFCLNKVMWVSHLGENEATDMQEGNTGEMHSV